MREQLALRDARVRSGARQIGWKVGFGSPTALRALDIALPLTGFLLDEGLLEDGTSVDIGAWASPVLEPEIAVHISRDVEADATLDQVRESIGALSAAIELADVDIEPSDVHQILARNIFQRHVLLGARDRTRASSEGIGVHVSVDSRVAVSTDNPSLLTGELADVVHMTAERLAMSGERLRAGHVVITGSVVPPLSVKPGQRVDVGFGALGHLTVSFT